MKLHRGLVILKGILIVQSVLTLVLAVFYALVYSKIAALSALIGGITCILPNVVFAVVAFKYQGARSAKKIVQSFYTGEALKLFIAVILFAMVFSLLKIEPVAFFVTYIMVQMCVWFTPWLVNNLYRRPKSD